MAFGMQKDDGHSLVHYKTFSSTLQKQVMAFIRGGGRMFVSGAYIGSDMQRGDERDFLSEVFKTSYGGSDCNQTNNTVNGLGISFDLIRHPNAVHYAATNVNVMRPANASSFCAMQYADGTDAAVAYDGADYKCFVMGFPFECINSIKARQQVMKAVMNFLTKK